MREPVMRSLFYRCWCKKRKIKYKHVRTSNLFRIEMPVPIKKSSIRSLLAGMLWSLRTWMFYITSLRNRWIRDSRSDKATCIQERKPCPYSWFNVSKPLKTLVYCLVRLPNLFWLLTDCRCGWYCGSHFCCLLPVQDLENSTPGLDKELEWKKPCKK